MQDNQLFAVEVEEGEVKLNYNINFSDPESVAELIKFLKNSEKRLVRTLEVLNSREMKKIYEENSVLKELEEDLEQASNLSEIWGFEKDSIWTSE